MSKKLKTILIVVGVILVVGFMVFGKIIAEYNRVIAMDENVKGKWAQVENQLKRRYDLIPNLVETVKGYAKHEKELFENIAQARTEYFQAKDVKNKIKASNQLEGVLKLLKVCASCGHTVEESACRNCLDEREEEIPPLMKTII